jgi:hypothetical protein
MLVIIALLAGQSTAFAKEPELQDWETMLAAVTGEDGLQEGKTEPAEKVPGYQGGFGVSFRQIQLDIMEGSENLIVASIRGNFTPSPFFNLLSPVRYFGGGKQYARSRFGYYWKYSFSTFSMDEQESFFGWESQWQDMGTSVRGQFFYVMPVLIWEPKQEYNKTMRWGLGFGLGYLSMNGDVIIYQDFDFNQPFTHDISINELTTGWYISWEYGMGGMVFGVSVGSLTGSTNPYKYDLMDVSLDVGLRKEF